MTAAYVFCFNTDCCQHLPVIIHWDLYYIITYSALFQLLTQNEIKSILFHIQQWFRMELLSLYPYILFHQKWKMEGVKRKGAEKRKTKQFCSLSLKAYMPHHSRELSWVSSQKISSFYIMQLWRRDLKTPCLSSTDINLFCHLPHSGNTRWNQTSLLSEHSERELLTAD